MSRNKQPQPKAAQAIRWTTGYPDVSHCEPPFDGSRYNTLSWLRWSPRHVGTIRKHIERCHATGHDGGLWCREHEFWCAATHVRAVTTGCGVREIQIDGAEVSDSDLREFFGGNPWHPSETIRTEGDNP